MVYRDIQNRPSREQLEKDYEELKSAYKLSRKYCVKPNVVYNWMIKEGIKRNKPGGNIPIDKPTKEQLDDSNTKSIRLLIKNARLKKNLSQSGLAKECGLETGQVQRFELLDVLTPRKNLLKVLEVLEIKPKEYLRIVPNLDENINYPDIHDLGSLIRESRKKKETHLSCLSKKINLNASQLGVWEHNHSKPALNKIRELEKIASILDIPDEQIQRFVSYYKQKINSLGKLIRKYRLENNFSSTEIKDKTNISQSNISAYERDNYKPSKEKLEKIVNLLRIPKKEVIKYCPDYRKEDSRINIIYLLKKTNYTLTEISKKTKFGIKKIWGIEKRAIESYTRLTKKGISEEELEDRKDVLNPKYKRLHGTGVLKSQINYYDKKEYSLEEGVKAYIDYYKKNKKPTTIQNFFLYDPETSERARLVIPLGSYFRRIKKLSKLSNKSFNNVVLELISNNKELYNEAEKIFKLGKEKKPNGYWTFEKTFEKIKELFDKLGHFPTLREMEKEGMVSISTIIHKYGGINKFREILGLEQKRKAKNFFWNFENTFNECRKIVDEKGYLPSQKELYKIGKSSLNIAIIKNGGYGKFREILGLEQKRKPNGFWSLENILEECRKIIEEKGYLPCREKLNEMKRYDISHAIGVNGGMYKIRELLGLPTSRKNSGALEQAIQEYLGR